MFFRGLVFATVTATAVTAMASITYANTSIVDLGNTAYIGGCKVRHSNSSTSCSNVPDVIGNRDVFEIFQMDIGYNPGNSNNAFVKIWTNYMGQDTTFGTNFGDLLIHSNVGANGYTPVDFGGSPAPDSSAPGYLGDHFEPDGNTYANGDARNEWNFAILMDRTNPNGHPGAGDTVYSSEFLKVSDNDIDISNDLMTCCTYRHEQPVGIKRTGATTEGISAAEGGPINATVTIHNTGVAANSGNYLDDNFGSYILFEWDDPNRMFLGGNWAASWAITCGNDIVQVDWPPQVPEPAALSLFGVGLLGLGLRRRLKRQGSEN